MASEAVLNAVDSTRCSVLFGCNGRLVHVAESVVLGMGDTFGVSSTKPNNVFGRRIILCSDVSRNKIRCTEESFR